jgi:hypothetical protein
LRGESEWKREVYGRTTKEGRAEGREEGRRKGKEEKGREGKGRKERRDGGAYCSSTEKHT